MVFSSVGPEARVGDGGAEDHQEADERGEAGVDVEADVLRGVRIVCVLCCEADVLCCVFMVYMLCCIEANVLALCRVFAFHR